VTQEVVTLRHNLYVLVKKHKRFSLQKKVH
jgi:hypothetical protein